MPNTARELHDALYDLSAYCRECYRGSRADLPALVASGRGDLPVDRLPWRCTACGCRRVEFRIGCATAPDYWAGFVRGR